MATRPITLTIAGSDSGGGAGIQADLKTFAVLGCFGTSALTAITAQNTHGVQSVVVLPAAFVTQQIRSVADDLRPAATKTGMLGSADVVNAVADAVESHRLSPLVVDPVMIAKGGDRLVDDETIDVMIRRLLPLATLATPNRYEAARLVGFAVDNEDAAARAAAMICQEMGAAACVVKAIRSDRDSADVAWLGEGSAEPLVMRRSWHSEAPQNTHGSGCTYSAAITAWLGRGLGMRQAIEAGKEFIDKAIRSPVRVGGGVSPVDHLAWLDNLSRSDASGGL